MFPFFKWTAKIAFLIINNEGQGGKSFGNIV